MAGKAKKQTVLPTIIISGIILCALLIVLYFLENTLSNIFGALGGKIVVGLMLFVMWLTVGSAVRTVIKHQRSAGFFTLLITGVLTATIGSALFTAFLLVFPKVSKATDTYEIAGASGGIILVMSGLGFIASLLAITNAKVKSKFLGNLLELLIIGACVAGFLYFTTK